MLTFHAALEKRKIVHNRGSPCADGVHCAAAPPEGMKQLEFRAMGVMLAFYG